MPLQLIAGRYEIEREIGRGGMGQVYRAHDTRLGRTVAIKRLPPEMMHDAELRRRLAQEARAASVLNHPGIATVYDYEEQEGESFIVFEYVEGITLRERSGQRRFTLEEIVDAGIQLAEALAAAHERGVVHRDLKPENVMVVKESGRLPRVKILDFGLAKQRHAVTPAAGEGAAETATVATSRGLIVGTVNYMSPEQLEGEPADARSDLYALGLVLYEMATGANPFLGKTPTSTIANILKQEPPPVLERNPVAPAELDRIVRKCLRKRPEERYQSARELAVDLANLRRDSGRSRPAAEPEVQPQVEPAGTGVFSRGAARGTFLSIQVGYLVMYAATYYNIDKIELPFPLYLNNLVLLFFLAGLVGTPVRLYLLSAVAADYPETGAKFRWLFPVLLVLDFFWAFSPVLLGNKLRGLAFLCIAALLYLPFAQRRLLYDAYSPRGGRISGTHRIR